MPSEDIRFVGRTYLPAIRWNNPAHSIFIELISDGLHVCHWITPLLYAGSQDQSLLHTLNESGRSRLYRDLLFGTLEWSQSILGLGPVTPWRLSLSLLLQLLQRCLRCYLWRQHFFVVFKKRVPDFVWPCCKTVLFLSVFLDL